jgi:hypothetical protein
MSTTWSLYVVPDHWTLRDCMTMGYMTRCSLMVNDDELDELIKSEQRSQTSLYNEIIDQPHIYGFASDDCGSQESEKILDIIGLFGRLYPVEKEAYKLIPKLKAFEKKYYGKRFMCLN